MTQFNDILQQHQAEADADTLCGLIDVFTKAARSDLRDGNFEGISRSVDQLTAAMKAEIPREVAKRRSDNARADIEELEARLRKSESPRRVDPAAIAAGKEISDSYRMEAEESKPVGKTAAEITVDKMALDLSKEAGVDYETALARIVRAHPHLAANDEVVRKKRLGL